MMEANRDHELGVESAWPAFLDGYSAAGPAGASPQDAPPVLADEPAFAASAAAA